jgi:hypothetical protein
MFWTCGNSYGRCSTKKLKVALFSMSSKNEFIIERILFFGINTNRVKQSGVNKICVYNLHSNIKVVQVRWSLQHQQIWMINLNRNTGRTEFPVIRDRRLEVWNGEKLPVANEDIPIFSCNAVKRSDEKMFTLILS